MKVLLVLAAVAALAAPAATLGATRTAAGPCGVVSTAGQRWYVVANGLSCGTAKTLLTRIGTMRVRANHVVCDQSSSDPRFKCGYAKMKCNTTSRPGGRPTMLACFVGANHNKGFGAQGI